MKGSTILAIASVAMVLGLSSCASLERKSANATRELFNGKDLEGWTHVLAEPNVPREAVWSVRDGILICKGAPLGVLQTERVFTNFRLVLEYRWAPGTKPGNSGILTRINGALRPLPRCTEVQLQSGSAGDVLGLQGMQVASGQPRYFEVMNHAVAGDIRGVKKTADAERPAGEWNRVEVLAQGDSYTVWMNGSEINQARGVESRSGQIGLQSEGGEIHFRRVTLKPLPD